MLLLSVRQRVYVVEGERWYVGGLPERDGASPWSSFLITDLSPVSQLGLQPDSRATIFVSSWLGRTSAIPGWLWCHQ